MHKKIVVLGMDNTGKTTLANKLSETFDAKHVFSLGKGHTKEKLTEYLTKELNSSEDSVFERFSLFDEMVYGKVLRGSSEFTFGDKLLETLLSKSPVIIYCRPADEVVEKWNDREQMEGVIEQHKLLLETFDDTIYQLEEYYPVVWFDYTKDSYENLVNYIKAQDGENLEEGWSN